MLTIFSRQFWEIFFTKLRLNIKSEASETYLGYLWWILEPAMFITAMYFVFGVLLGTRTSEFITFLVCGQVPFSWFARSVPNASRSLLAGRGIINQVYIPKPFFPLLTVAQDFAKQGVVFIAVMGYFLIVGQAMTPVWFTLIPVILVQFILVAAFGVLLSAFVPVIPDLKFIIGTGVVILMFVSGIFYSYTEVLLPRHQELFLMNPMANLIKNYRQVILDNQFPDWTALAMIAGLSLLLLAVMLLFFRRYDNTYARLVTQ